MMTINPFIPALCLLAAASMHVANLSAAEKFDTDPKHELARPDTKAPDTNKRGKVFILLGQSNMVGMGDIGPETNKGRRSRAGAERPQSRREEGEIAGQRTPSGA